MRFLDDLLITLPNLPKALCADPSIPADSFYPAGRLELFAVLPMVMKICERCPEKEPCLQYAIEQELFDGIWAGTTGSERRLMAMSMSKRPKRKAEPSKSQSTIQKALPKRSTPSRLQP